jgi:hypothetical protein
MFEPAAKHHQADRFCHTAFLTTEQGSRENSQAKSLRFQGAVTYVELPRPARESAGASG